MGTTWKISFTAYEIPRERFEDVKKIIADVLTPNYDFYLADDKNSGEIEIFNYETCSSFDFEDFAIRELKKRIWANGFIKFSFGCEVVDGVDAIEFGENEFRSYRNENDNDNYIDDYEHYIDIEDDLARSFDSMNGL